MVNCAGFTRLTSTHMVEDILNGPAVRDVALLLLTVGLLPVPHGALVGVEEHHQLLPNQLPPLFLFVRYMWGAWTGPRIYFVHKLVKHLDCHRVLDVCPAHWAV